MKAVSEKFTKKLVQHKKLISNMFKTEDKEMVVPVQQTAQELALVFADCRCEGCNINVDLQYHHLIQRYLKDFMNFWKYMSQRYYWANILILCRTCHSKAENRHVNIMSGTIAQSYINKIKQKYNIE